MSCTNCNQDKCCCVTPFRYRGPNVDCLGIVTDQAYDSLMELFASEICELNETLDEVQGVDHVSFTSSTGSPSTTPNQPGQVDTYTLWGDVAETINLGTFAISNGTAGIDGTDGLDASTDYGNTLFVDKVYGNDTTGTKEDFGLPYLTYAAALLDAVDGDTIILRAGTYVENITLSNGVNVHCENGVSIQGSITDSGVAATSTVSGNANIIYTTDNAIDIQGIGSNIEVSVDTIDCTRTAILVRPGVGNTSKAVVNCRRILGTTVNYWVTCNGTSEVTLNVRESMETASFLTNPVAGINIQEFDGNLVVKCPKVVLGDSSNVDNGVFFDEFSLSGAGRVYIEVDELLNNFALASPNELKGTIFKKGACTAIFNIKRMKCLTGTGISIISDTGLTVFEGHISTVAGRPVRNMSTGSLVIKNSTLHRSGGVGGNEVVACGSFGVDITDLGGATDDIKVEIINSRILRTNAVAVTAGDGAVLTTEGASSKILLKDCDIISEPIIGGATAPIACDGPALEGRFYINNVKTNLVTGTGSGFVQLESNAGEFVVNDTELGTYDILD